MTVLERSAPSAAALGVAGVGVAALLARPLAAGRVASPTALLIVVFVVLGLVGVCWRLPQVPSGWSLGVSVSLHPAAALAMGLGAFAVGRLLGPGRLEVGVPPLIPLLLNALAAATEEAFFRRFLYGVLAPWGPTVALVGSAVAFAAVHVTVWGIGVLPLDLAAGLILSWQRAATGGWGVPALTHVAANVLGTL